ncbi:TonB-dependent receptor [Glacieibacterium frigidum]|uniref:TonB-dependent receptor n=1 Tax=Glacieibacterium frigidum TaxID=2593303 RepID=UPI00163D7196|nr:TonB-dependent siderophore receptor [Glacieibacterium frigidum]
MHLRLCAVLSAVGVALPAYGQDAPAAGRDRRERDEIVVTANRAVDGGQVAGETRLGILGNGDIYETPFSVKGFTSELILNQGARSLDEVVTNDPSIRVALNPTFVIDQSAIRGFVVFSANYLFDGLPNLTADRTRTPILHFERVDVLKGPSTALIGGATGNTAGGSINFVPKRAIDEPVTSIDASFRESSSFAAHADVGRRFGKDGMFGLRINASGETGKAYNGTDTDFGSVQAAFDVRAGGFRAVLDAGYTHSDVGGFGVNYSLAAGATLPTPPDPRLQQFPDWAGSRSRNHLGLITAEYDLSDRWTLTGRAGLSYGITNEPAPAIGPVRSDGTFVINNLSLRKFASRRTALEATVRGRFETGGLNHRVVVSASQFAGGSDFAPSVTVASPLAVGSIYQTVAIANPFAGDSPLALDKLEQPRQRGVSVADTIGALNDRVLVTLAARYQEVRQIGYNENKVTPTIAVLIKATDAISLYGNYAESLSAGQVAPATGVANPGAVLPPFVAEQYEGGVKWNAGSFGVTAAYFDISQQSAITDPTTLIFSANGLQRNRGVELETFGEPVKGLRLLGGVAYIDGRQERTPGGVTDGKKALGVSPWNVSGSVEWDIPRLAGLTVTGRYIYTDRAFINVANTQSIPSWERFDLGARYRTEIAGTPTTVRLNVVNVLDKTNWLAAAGRNLFVVGVPRLVTLSVSAAFR